MSAALRGSPLHRRRYFDRGFLQKEVLAESKVVMQGAMQRAVRQAERFAYKVATQYSHVLHFEIKLQKVRLDPPIWRLLAHVWALAPAEPGLFAAGACTCRWVCVWGGGAADAQTAHPATSSTAPAHQLLGSANAETTPAGAPAAAADRKQRPDATCEGRNGWTVQGPVKEQQPDGMSHRGGEGGSPALEAAVRPRGCPWGTRGRVVSETQRQVGPGKPRGDQEGSG